MVILKPVSPTGRPAFIAAFSKNLYTERGSKMEKLNYDVLKKSGYDGYILGKGAAPVKVLQFGEGNFLRAFRGSENGEKVNRKRVISVVDACYNPYKDWEAVKAIARSKDLEYVASNTTEAGIVYDPDSKFDQVPPVSFPAKLTVLLYERFKAGQKGVTILSCELIDNNGQELRKCVLKHIEDWGLGEDFRNWVENENLFCSTLVDRIVPGRIRDPKEVEEINKENGYEDALLDVGEVFGVWYIEGPEALAEKLPFKKAGLNVHVVPQVAPYKKRKVRILNGAHTGFVLGAYLSGQNIVLHAQRDNPRLHEQAPVQGSYPDSSSGQEGLREFCGSCNRPL